VQSYALLPALVAGTQRHLVTSGFLIGTSYPQPRLSCLSDEEDRSFLQTSCSAVRWTRGQSSMTKADLERVEPSTVAEAVRADNKEVAVVDVRDSDVSPHMQATVLQYLPIGITCVKTWLCARSSTPCSQLLLERGVGGTSASCKPASRQALEHCIHAVQHMFFFLIWYSFRSRTCLWSSLGLPLAPSLLLLLPLLASAAIGVFIRAHQGRFEPGQHSLHRQRPRRQACRAAACKKPGGLTCAAHSCS
jgi:hypothetical protein